MTIGIQSFSDNNELLQILVILGHSRLSFESMKLKFSTILVENVSDPVL